MKNNIFRKVVLGTFTLLLSAVAGKMMAQDSQLINEVKIVKSDSFSELKSLLNDNFDYADVDVFCGVYNSEVKFDISDNGKVVNIIVNGENQEVNSEIKETLQELFYQFDESTLSQKMMAHTYVMPVRLILER